MSDGSDEEKEQGQALCFQSFISFKQFNFAKIRQSERDCERNGVRTMDWRPVVICFLTQFLPLNAVCKPQRV